MKIGVIVIGSLQSGGGFNQALNAVSQMRRLCDDRFEIEVYCCHEESLSILKQLGFTGKYFRFALSDRLAVLANMHPLFGRFLRHVIPTGNFERRLIRDGVDLVYFTAPCLYAIALCRLNYISTVWDLCHRDMPEFPEVRFDGEFESRELLSRSTLSKAYLILTDSAELAGRVEHRYGIDSERILPMPFSPAPFLTTESKADNKINSIKGGYFFYPAQFWSHKNHIRILEALRLLKDRTVSARVVFCGKDYGNLNWVRENAARLEVADQVDFLGFVSPEEMDSLYDNCLAVLMPTYFGPTNIPPLEAWFKGKPLIYSEHLRSQSRDAALLVDPDSAESLAEGMVAMLRAEVREEYVSRGRYRLEEIMFERNVSEEKLLNKLIRFERRRMLWK